MIYWQVADGTWMAKLEQYPDVYIQAESENDLERRVRSTYLEMVLDGVPKNRFFRKIII
jgi:predicted RNase H-like HicB family nuclease